jgi:hypothetical protein
VKTKAFINLLSLAVIMSDPTTVCVAVVMTPEHFDEYDEEDGSFVDFCYEKFERYTYRNKNREEQGLPKTISFGYENPASGGSGQNASFQDYGSNGEAFIVGYELAWTWHGVIMLNEPLLKSIETAKGLLKPLFPDFTPQVIVRGQQV